jgi:hypothetical protein
MILDPRLWVDLINHDRESALSRPGAIILGRPLAPDYSGFKSSERAAE